MIIPGFSWRSIKFCQTLKKLILRIGPAVIYLSKHKWYFCNLGNFDCNWNHASIVSLLQCTIANFQDYWGIICALKDVSVAWKKFQRFFNFRTLRKMTDESGIFYFSFFPCFSASFFPSPTEIPAIRPPDARTLTSHRMVSIALISRIRSLFCK